MASRKAPGNRPKAEERDMRNRSTKDRYDHAAPITRLGRALRPFAVLPVAMSLAACAQQKTMYDWQSYQPAVYSYLKDDGADYAAQASVMEKNIETARSANQALPPGFHAHLGMLYLKMGSGDKAVEQLQNEKLAFPEGTPFMDFLMRNSGQAGPGQAKLPAATPSEGQPAAAPTRGSPKGTS
jgi:hypothetical protein